MATLHSRNTFPADGARTEWDFQFSGVNMDTSSGTVPYLYPENVKARELYVDENGAQRAIPRDGTLIGPTRFRVTGAPVAAGRQVQIYRETPILYPLVDYRDRQVVSEFDLDLANRQAIFVAQETQDIANTSIVLDDAGNFDVNNRRIVNLAPGRDPTDAANMAQLERTIRAPETDAAMTRLPAAADRVGRFLSFDALGQPIVKFPDTDSAAALENALAEVGGGRKVGYLPGVSVVDFLDGLRAAAGAGSVGYGPGGGSVMDFLDLLRGTTGSHSIGNHARTVGASLDDMVNAADIGPMDTPANVTSTLMATYTAATLQGKAIAIPAGRYVADSIPNMATNNLHIYALGKVVIKTLAPGWAWDLTAGAANRFNFRVIGDLSIEGNASSTGGIHVQALNHTELELRVYNVNGPAFQIDSGVLTRFKLTASINVGTAAEWAIVPSTGLVVDGRGGSAGDFVSACWFDVRLEGVSGVGFHAINMQQCSITGTSEHNGSFGIRTEIGCRYNTWNQLDLEQNLDNDIRIGGVCDTWIGMACRSSATTNNIEVLSTAENNMFIGGDLRCANMNVGSFGTHFEGCRFSDNGSLGMKGAGDFTHNRCYVYNLSNVRTATYTPKLGAVGTFLPTLVGETVAGALTYSTRTGRYAKIGGYLEFDIDLVVSALDPAMSGRLLLTGIPIPSRADIASAGPVGLFVQVVIPTAGCTGMSWRVGAGTATMTFPCPRFNDVSVDMTAASLKVGTRLTFSGRIPLADKI